MADQKPQKKRKPYEHHMVWVSVFMLSILVTATMAVLGNALYAYAHRSDCVIDLTGTEPEGTVLTGTMPDTLPDTQDEIPEEDSVKPETTVPGGGSRDVTEPETTVPSGIPSSLPSGRAARGSLQVRDDDVVWSTDTQIELFKTSYENESGERTVRSANSDHVIAPGTDGKYTFTLKNKGSQKLKYQVRVEAEVESPLTEFPLEARMTGKNGWMAGDDNTWVMTENLDGASESSSLSAGKSAEYTIYWQWPFERDADETDTTMSNLSADQDISCKIRIYTLATEVSSGSHDNKDKNADENPSTGILGAIEEYVGSSVVVPKTGDDANIWWWIFWIVLAAAGITICLYMRQRRKEQDEDIDDRDTTAGADAEETAAETKEHTKNS